MLEIAFAVISAVAAPQETAAQPQLWSLVPRSRPALPSVRDGAWARTDTDRFVQARREAKGVAPAADADRRTLIRRATLDLTGLPPTPEAVDAFVRDARADAFERVVDRLLASPQFGERWGRHWLDVVRFAESTGRTRNFPFPVAWRYRDYVIQAFNADKPYDEFLREQIAGDLLPPSPDRAVQNARKIATGFLAMGTKDLNERNRQQYVMDQVDDQIDVMGRAVMALTVSCARCHDHKFDPIPTKDYYALAGIFKSTTLLDGYANRSKGNRGYFKSDRYHKLDLGKAGATDVAPKPGAKSPRRRGRRGKRAKQQAQQKQRRLAEIRAELQQLAAARRKLKRRDRAGQRRIRNRTTQLKREQRQLNNGKGKKGKRGRNPAAKLAGNEAMGVRDGAKPGDIHVLLRGDVQKEGPLVPRGFLSAITGEGHAAGIGPEESGRLQLAHWLTRPDHPLTARVMVNRVWHHLFGAGLVRTVDNFGKSGAQPTHPQLLDFLAGRFVDGGWSVKKLIRELMLSRTYQLSSHRDARGYAVDPDNRLLWRMAPRRLTAEAIRDSMLAVAGRLELTPPKGSAVMAARPAELGRQRGAISPKFAARNRSVYLPIVRNAVPQMLCAFDFAEPSAVTGKRDVTTVATQALFLMNNEFVVAQARHAAASRLQAEMSDAERADTVYRAALGRLPTPRERHRVLEYVKSSGASPGGLDPWVSVFQAVFASAEFRYVR